MDLVVGPPEAASTVRRRPPTGRDDLIPAGAMARAVPSEVWLVVDAKGVMTEHGKARRNRQRDVTALWTVMKAFMPNVVVGAIVPINIAARFWSPLRGEGNVTEHVNIERLVSDTLGVFRAVRLTSRTGRGIDALGCFVVDFDNIGTKSRAKLVTSPPAPAPDDPIHYDNFVKDLASQLVERFGSRFG
jgi:hypothetical protein